MNILQKLNWRYATKKFDPSKKISAQDLDVLKEVLRLTPSSYGLQPWKFVIVENQVLREELKIYSWGQSQVTDASHLIVICTYIDMSEEYIDSHIKHTAEQRNIEPEKLQGYGNFVKKKMEDLTLEQKRIWNSKQAYIALGQFMLACAEMQIDATPMEGFEPEKYNEILGLSERGLQATLVCPIGYRSSEDPAQFNPKVRRPIEDIFEVI
jgi:nitroreductase